MYITQKNNSKNHHKECGPALQLLLPSINTITIIMLFTPHEGFAPFSLVKAVKFVSNHFWARLAICRVSCTQSYMYVHTYIHTAHFQYSGSHLMSYRFKEYPVYCDT